MHSVHDRELLDILEHMGGEAMQANVWRLAWKFRHVLDVGAGGRWNPPGRFDALYTSSDIDGAIAEVYHHLSQAPVRSSAEKLLYPINVETARTLRLDTQEARDCLSLTEEILTAKSPDRTREIGAAAFLLEYDSMLVPSARWRCSNLVVFPEFLPEAQFRIGEPEPINWPAWREQHEAEFNRIRRTGLRI